MPRQPGTAYPRLSPVFHTIVIFFLCSHMSRGEYEWKRYRLTPPFFQGGFGLAFSDYEAAGSVAVSIADSGN